MQDLTLFTAKLVIPDLNQRASIKSGAVEGAMHFVLGSIRRGIFLVPLGFSLGYACSAGSGWVAAMTLDTARMATDAQSPAVTPPGPSDNAPLSSGPML